jgi:polyhydroxybutyrate depolymerase
MSSIPSSERATLRRVLAPGASVAFGAVLLLAAACSSSNGGNTGSGGSGAGSVSSSAGAGAGGDGGSGGKGRGTDPAINVDLQNRLYDVIVPSGYDASKPAPLLLMIHGFVDASTTTTPWTDMDTYMKISPEADKRGVIVALVHATIDNTLGRYFWNATDSCCDFEKSGINDVGYIMAVVKEVTTKYAVDPKRLFILGHSNGGFMTHRLACDQADKFAAVVSLAGEVYKDPTRCAASAPISVLEVQGDADMTVPYAGGPPENVAVLPPAPGAIETTQTWAAKNNCDVKADTTQPPVDLVTDLTGAETSKLVYKNCEAGVATELWTIHGGPHSPNFNASWAPTVLDFLMAHPKP